MTSLVLRSVTIGAFAALTPVVTTRTSRKT